MTATNYTHAPSDDGLFAQSARCGATITGSTDEKPFKLTTILEDVDCPQCLAWWGSERAPRSTP